MNLFGIVVAALAMTVIVFWFRKAIAPLRRGRDLPPQCLGCSGCDGANPPSCPMPGKTLYEIDRPSTLTDSQEP